jgi:hypothetical protein
MEVEKALKQTIDQLQELKEASPSIGSFSSPFTRRTEIERLAAKRMATADISDWMSETKEVRSFLEKLRQDVSTWSSFLLDKIDQSGADKVMPVRIRSNDFLSHNFFFTMSDAFFEELEATEKICYDLDVLFPEVVQTLESDSSDFTPMKLRHHASDLRLKISEIDNLVQGITDRVLANYYDDVFLSDDKRSVVLPFSLYDYKLELEKKIEVFTAQANLISESKDWTYEVGDNLTLKNHNDQNVKTEVVNLREGLKEIGLIPKDTDGNVFSSIFADRAIKKPIVWPHTQYELHYLIKQLMDYMEESSIGAYTRGEKLFIRSNGKRFKNLMNPGSKSTLPPQREAKYRKLLDRVTKNLK